MRVRFTPLAAASFSALFASLILAGCHKKEPTPASTPIPPPTPVPIDVAKIRPNELGKIPVVMYHDIGAKTGRDPSLNISPDVFRAQLQLLYDKGFVPVNLSDVVNDRIDVPAGKSPVVLTFDDGRQTQFRLLDAGESLKIDPNCGLGIFDAFVKAHPDWKTRATFFILPKSRATMEPFGQAGMGAQKISYLTEHGMEIANHSTLHKSFANYTPADIQRELGGAQNAVQAEVAGAVMETVALPMGVYPRNKANWKYLLDGEFEGKPYHYKAAMMAAWRPIPSPSSKEFNPLRLERISPIAGLNGLEYWVNKLVSLGDRYISDGQPDTISFPRSDEKRFAANRVTGKQINAYQLSGGGARPIITDDTPSKAAPAPAASPGVTAAPANKPIAGG